MCSYIDEVTAVIGYEAEKFSCFIDERAYQLPVQTIRNENYESTGPIYSLHLGLNAVEGCETIIQNGDTIFTKAFYRQIAGDLGNGITIVISRPNDYTGDDMKVIENKGNFSRVGKEVEANPSAISAGFVSVRGQQSHEVVSTTVQEALNEEGVSTKRYWHSILNELSTSGVPINLTEVDVDSWMEIDTVEDLEAAKATVNLR